MLTRLGGSALYGLALSLLIALGLVACDKIPFLNQEGSDDETTTAASGPESVTATTPTDPAQPQPVAAVTPIEAQGTPTEGGKLNTGQPAADGKPNPGAPGAVAAIVEDPKPDPGTVAPPEPDPEPASRVRGRCTNTCQYASDGECDDGRPNAHTSLCRLGTDCADCGRAGRPFRRGSGGRCTNTCQYANDGECDDGRPNAHTSVCAAGTDCGDCGPAGRPYVRPGQGGAMMVANAACTNTCQHANDNECDDGRPNAHTSICAAGTDCNDCGPVGRPYVRPGQGGAMTVANAACTNTCQHANDGECDDGRPNAHTSVCSLGTDCGDCGPVGRPFRRGGTNSGGTGLCVNTCAHANDGECDDGRPGSVTSLCARGTDCNDCGR
jgi:hypothetical protein